jgi:hypothetical protein
LPGVRFDPQVDRALRLAAGAPARGEAFETLPFLGDARLAQGGRLASVYIVNTRVP